MIFKTLTRQVWGGGGQWGIERQLSRGMDVW